MRIRLHGTLSGQVPVAERLHACWSVEVDGRVYWIDAAEGVSRAASQAGVNLLATRGIFLSAMNMECIGGLPNLLWLIRYLSMMDADSSMADIVIPVMIPHIHSWAGMIEMLEGATGNRFARDFVLKVVCYQSGLIFQDDWMCVSAFPNVTDTGKPKVGNWSNYSFQIDAEKRRVVSLSGACAADTLKSLFASSCDVLLLSVADRPLAESCRFLAECKADIGRLVLTGLSPTLLETAEHLRQTAQDLIGLDPLIPDDGAVIDV